MSKVTLLLVLSSYMIPGMDEEMRHYRYCFLGSIAGTLH
jgi:hypothetical protein